LLLGLVAVGIAFSSYQSSLWGGEQDKALTDSVLASNESVDLLQHGDTNLSSDQALFTVMLTSGDCGELGDLLDLDLDAVVDDFTSCGQIVLGLSLGGLEAVRVWQSNDELYPFSTDEYLDYVYEDGEKAQEASSGFLEDAHKWNKNGDDYELASTFLTIALFFAGISFVFSRTAIRWSLLVGSTTVLVGSVAFLLSLPRKF
jgi:hypothetical protein